MSTENKYAIALGILCVLLLAGGTLLARSLSRADPKIVRIAWPVTALVTGAIFATFVFIARQNAR